MSYSFDGTGNRISWANPFAAWPTTSTVLAWVRPAGIQETPGTLFRALGYHGIVAIAGGSSNRLRFESTWTNALGRWAAPDDSIPNNVWTGVAASYDGGSTTNNPVLYVKPEGGSISAPTVTEEITPDGTWTPEFAEGLWTGALGSPSYAFTGRIAYVRMFGSILTEQQVDDELSSASAVLANPLLDCPMVSDALDLSANNRDGTVIGATLDGNNPTLSGGGGGGGVNPMFARRMARWLNDL